MDKIINAIIMACYCTAAIGSASRSTSTSISSFSSAESFLSTESHFSITSTASERKKAALIRGFKVRKQMEAISKPGTTLITDPGHQKPVNPFLLTSHIEKWETIQPSTIPSIFTDEEIKNVVRKLVAKRENPDYKFRKTEFIASLLEHEKYAKTSNHYANLIATISGDKLSKELQQEYSDIISQLTSKQ